MSLVLAAGGMFLTLAQFEAYGSGTFTDAVKHGAKLSNALFLYWQASSWQFVKLAMVSGVFGIVSAFIFFHPLLQQSKAAFADLFDDGLKRINELSYALSDEYLLNVDGAWLSTFINKVLTNLVYVTKAQFAVFSMSDGAGGFTVFNTAGWGGPRMNDADPHSLHFIPPHDHYISHSGQHSRGANGVRVSYPSVGAKIIHPQNSQTLGVLWISVNAAEKYYQPIERLTKLAANIISLSFLKYFDSQNVVNNVHLEQQLQAMQHAAGNAPSQQSPVPTTTNVVVPQASSGAPHSASASPQGTSQHQGSGSGGSQP